MQDPLLGVESGGHHIRHGQKESCRNVTRASVVLCMLGLVVVTMSCLLSGNVEPVDILHTASKYSTILPDFLGLSGGLLVVILVVLVIPVILACSNWLGSTIQTAIETYDTSVIGVDVEFGSLTVLLYQGRICLTDMVVKNPEGRDFKSDYLMKASKVVIDIGVLDLIKSGLKKIVVEEVTLEGIDAIVEYKGMFGGESNVHDVLESLNGSEAGQETQEEDIKTKPEGTPEEKPPKPEGGGRVIVIKTVVIRDIGMKLQTSLLGARVAAADLEFDDFSQANSAYKVQTVLYLLLKSVVKTVLANVVGQGFAEKFL